MQTQIRGLATYTIPKVGVQVSGTWQSNPGPQLAANYVVTNAEAKKTLERDLSGGAANVTVNLIPAGTYYAPRRNNLDFRVAKILKFGRTRSQVTLDIYNLTNSSAVQTYNQTYGNAWLTPTDIQPARYVKANVQFDF